MHGATSGTSGRNPDGETRHERIQRPANDLAPSLAFSRVWAGGLLRLNCWRCAAKATDSRF